MNKGQKNSNFTMATSCIMVLLFECSVQIVDATFLISLSELFRVIYRVQVTHSQYICSNKEGICCGLYVAGEENLRDLC